MSGQETFSKMYESKHSQGFTGWDMRSPKLSESEEPLISEQEIQRQELEALKVAAREEGYQKGLSDAQEEILQLKEKWLTMLEDISKPHERFHQELDRQAIKTLITLCQQCIGIDIKMNPEHLEAIWNKVIQYIPMVQEPCQLMMSPNDLQWLREQFSESEHQLILEKARSNDDLSPGDFLLHFENGEIDGRIQTRLHTIVRTMLDEAFQEPDKD